MKPREHAAAILEKVRALLREEMEQVPKEFRAMTADHVVSSLSIEYFKRRK